MPLLSSVVQVAVLVFKRLLLDSVDFDVFFGDRMRLVNVVVYCVVLFVSFVLTLNLYVKSPDDVVQWVYCWYVCFGGQ